jgi:hypothetical protein
MQAGLPGKWLVEVEFADIPLRDQTLGYGRAAALSSDSPPFDPEASNGNPGLNQFTASVHCCDFVNVTVVTD